MADAVTIIACICYIEWGLIHIAAGGMTWGSCAGGACTAGPAAGGLVPVALMGGMSDAEKDAFKATKYAKFSHRVYLQHGWNLFYVGVWSILCIIPLLNDVRLAWWFGLHQYLFDWGYFMGIDWVGRGGRVGQAQTFIVSTGLLCSAFSVNNAHDVPGAEMALTALVPCLLIAAGLFCIVREFTCPTCMDCSGPDSEVAVASQPREVTVAAQPQV